MDLDSSGPRGAFQSTAPHLVAFTAGIECQWIFQSHSAKLSVDLPFWDLEDGGPLLTAPVGNAPVGTLLGGVESELTCSFCTALAEVLHEGPAPEANIFLDIQEFPYIL